MQTIFFYTTSDCHLCEQAWDIISPLVDKLSLAIKKIEIADDDWLLDNYGTRIPVVRLDGYKEDLGWPFDSEDVIDYLSE